ncbi:MAG: hypothetical protein IVW57_17440 [Ktedonobacterales bacterium]|nr:hypothetical protein [Ktedonobacterales bacterium]
MGYRSVTLGALRYEFRMQVRRRSIWLVFALLGLLAYGLWYGYASDYLYGFYTNRLFDPEARVVGGRLWVPPSTTTAVLYWALFLAMFLPVGVGLVLADRLARDRQTRMEEVFETMPGSLRARLFGKYLGATLATLAPILLLYAVGVGYMFSQRPDGHALAVAVAAFAALVLPGAFFVAAFSVAVPALLKIPIYQLLFIGYWFWANLVPVGRGIPTISGTPLNASGVWTSALVHFQAPFARTHPTILYAIVNIALLIALSLAVLLAAERSVRWRWARL